jgi:succinyl-CoA synthetase alpha subunit
VPVRERRFRQLRLPPRPCCRGKGSAADKIAALREAGIAVAPTPADLGKTVAPLV